MFSFQEKELKDAREEPTQGSAEVSQEKGSEEGIMAQAINVIST